MFKKAENTINDLADTAKDKLNEVTSEGLKDSAENLANKSSSAVSDIKNSLTNKVESNPVGATFAGAFIGLIIGIFISRK